MSPTSREPGHVLAHVDGEDCTWYRGRRLRSGSVLWVRGLSTHPTQLSSLGDEASIGSGTSAAHFENSTVIPLAKVAGDGDYISLMEHLVAEPTTPYWLSYVSAIGKWLGIFRLVKRSMGLAPRDSSRVLSDMIAALKAASETALQVQIKTVAVTAPWVASWDGQIPVDSIVNDALVLAGLEPWTWWADEQIYLGEINTVLASEGLWLCELHWCIGHGMQVDEEASGGGPVFFLSFTNRSLHTSFQGSTCYFFNSWDNRLAMADPRYGFDKASQAPSPAQFWDELKARLLSLVKQHVKLDRGYPSRLPMTVLVTGEAADTPEFVDVVRAVVQAIPKLRAEGHDTPASEGDGLQETAELLIPKDRTYGAAKGAAYWMRTRMNRTYCEHVLAGHGIVDQYDMVRDGRMEL